MFKVFYEDLVTDETVTVGSVQVDKDEVTAFASKYDPQPFHLDDDFAKQTPFGGLCASGWHTCAMVMRLHVDYILREGIAGMGSPGVENLRWLKPVFPGDTLTLKVSLHDKRASESKPHLGLVRMSDEVVNQKGETVMTMTATMMMLRRPS